MKAHYDLYNYQNFWTGRDYEHRAEEIVLEYLLNQLPHKIDLLDIGAGYGRLAKICAPFCSSITLLEPSSKNLSLAKRFLKDTHDTTVSLTQGEASLLPFPGNHFDAAIMIRVMHHIPDPQRAILEASRVIKPQGYLILEYANKLHIKNLITSLLTGEVKTLSNREPSERRSARSIHKRTIPFVNHHPALIEDLLHQNKFKIVSTCSVSNLRNTWFSRHLPMPILEKLEQFTQIFSRLFSLKFGPSVFILAQKRPS